MQGPDQRIGRRRSPERHPRDRPQDQARVVRSRPGRPDPRAQHVRQGPPAPKG